MTKADAIKKAKKMRGLKRYFCRNCGRRHVFQSFMWYYHHPTVRKLWLGK